MQLHNVQLIGEATPVSISIKNGRIISVSAPAAADNEVQLSFTDAMATPGLINSHDHLDFNCFSPVSEKKYGDYTEWAKDVHSNHSGKIKAVLKIPQILRTQWGVYKNLLAGVTTVVNHGDHLHIGDPLIYIKQDNIDLHSVAFEKHYRRKLAFAALKKNPVVIHTGEGKDEASFEEINRLISRNYFRKKIIGVHGVAMTPEQAKNFRGLIWCPGSNEVLLGKHAPVEILKGLTTMVFGSDSTLSAHGNIRYQLRLARSLQKLTDEELGDAVTLNAARLWKLNKGSLAAGKDADIVISKTRNKPSWNTFYETDPQDILLVLQNGRIRMFDETIADQLLPGVCKEFSRISIKGKEKFIEGDLPGLMDAIRSFYPAMNFPCTSPAKTIARA